MNKNHFLLLSAAFYICANVASAQDSNDEFNDKSNYEIAAGADVESIVVTAARSPVSVAAIGSSVTVIDREYIEERQAVFAVDLLRDVPGVQVSRSGGSGKQTQLRIRGAEANHVLVMIDGIEVSDPTAADEFQWENLTTADISRIEVVRGPQSAIWGNEAVSGVVNIITRNDSQGLSASGYAEGGSFDTVNTGLRIGGGGEKLTGGASISYLDTEGNNISRAGSENDGYENTTVNLNAGWQATDDLNFSWIGRYTDSSTYSDAIDFIVTGLPTDPLPVTDDARREEGTNYYTGLTGDLITMDGRWRHNLRANLTSSDRDFYVDSGELSNNSKGDTVALYYVSSVGLTGPVTADSPILNLAVDWKKDEYAYRCFDAGGFDCTFFGDPNQNQDMTNTGVVAEVLSGDISGLSGSASIRYDDNSDFDNETSYRLTAGYLLFSNTRIRGAYGTGWKAPTFTERYGFFPDQFLGNPDIAPEKSKGWEVGFDQSFADEQYNLGATYFDERLENEINGFVFDPDSGLFTAANRDGESKRKGVELFADAALSADFKLLFNYTYLNASEPDPANPDEPVQELRRPRDSAALNANYRFFKNRVNMNLNIAYVGDRDDIYFPPFPEPSEIVELDAYTLVNLTGSYAINDTFDVYARVENLFDEDYEDVYGFATPGVGGYLGLRVSFAR